MLIKLPLDSEFYTENGKLRDDFKYSINVDELKIKDSKIIGKPEDKFETMLFLPVGEGRKVEGGLRTRGYFKFSYKYVDRNWFICDIEGNPLKPAPADIQEKINSYIKHLPEEAKHKIDELPLITVITVVLNGEKYLEQTIQSVINQIYPNVEYIIIDGGSTDGTVDIIKKYEDKIDYWVSEKDKGIYDAMNKGTRLAFGRWLNYMNSGDSFWNERTIENVFSLNKIDNQIALIYGNWVADYEGIKYQIKPLELKHIKNRIISAHNTFFFNRRILKIEGLYNIRYKFAADFDLIQRIYLKNFKILYIPCILSRFDTVHGVSSKLIFKSFIDRLRVIFHNLSIHIAIWSIIKNLVFGFFRYVYRKILILYAKSSFYEKIERKRKLF